MSAALLSVYEKSLAFTNPSGGNEPVRKNWDWSRQLQQIPVSNAQSQSFALAPGASLMVYSSLLTTGITGSTVVSMSTNAFNTSVYRFNIISGPGAFRTDRSLALNTKTVTVLDNGNTTATWSISGGGTPLSTVVVGDTVFIPGPVTGDSASPFDISNQGYWVVLSIAANSQSMILSRGGQVYSVANQAVVQTSNTQVDAFSAAGIQVGNFLNISAQFSASVQGTYVVWAVTPTWVEIVSSIPLPVQTSITQTTTSMLFYSSSKRFTRVESDQQVTVQYNGDVTNNNLVTPFQAGSSSLIGWVEKVGTVFSLVIVNNSIAPASLSVFSAE